MRKILKIIDSNKITLAYLNNLESGTVKQVINGEYILSFVALIEPLKTEFLYNKDNFIEYNNDWFRVINIEEEHNSDNMLKVYLNCEHISYDLIKQTKLTYKQDNRAAIYVMNDLLLSSGFQFLGTDIITTNSIEVKQETDIKSLLFMVTQIWGGELKYFQNTIELKQQLGTNRGVDFRWGKNLNNLRRYKDFVENTVAYEVEVIQGVLPKEFEGLEKFYLGDTIKVVDEALNIEINTRIIELETDIITGLNSRIVLGQPIKDLASGMSNIFNSIKNINTTIDTKTVELNNAIENAVEGINSNIDGINNNIDGINGNIADIQLALEDGIITTYYQSTEPTEAKIGDLWFNTLTKKLYRYSTTWQLIEDKDITTAIQTAQNAQDTADGKIVSFYQDTIPTTANSGDLWIDTNDSNKLYRYNNTSWVSARDGSLAKIDNVIDANGKLIAEKLAGNLNTAITKVSNSTGKTTFDDRGLIVHNQPAESVSTKAMLMTADGLLIANAKNADGTWRWRTAVTADGISADEITTGTLSAININGVNITGSRIVSEYGTFQVILDNGTLTFKNTTYANDGLQIHYVVTDPATGEASTVIEGSNRDSFQVYTTTDDMGHGEIELKLYASDNNYYGKLISQEMLWRGSSGGVPWGEFNVRFDSRSYTSKNSFNVYNGTKNAVIETEEFGDVAFSAYEMAEVMLGDIGENEVVNGECIINLDDKLLACVNTDISYQVFLTPYGKGQIYVKQRNKESFIVAGDNIPFGYEVKIKRKNYENIRFGEVV